MAPRSWLVLPAARGTSPNNSPRFLLLLIRPRLRQGILSARGLASVANLAPAVLAPTRFARIPGTWLWCPIPTAPEGYSPSFD